MLTCKLYIVHNLPTRTKPTAGNLFDYISPDGTRNKGCSSGTVSFPQQTRGLSSISMAHERGPELIAPTFWKVIMI